MVLCQRTFLMCVWYTAAMIALLMIAHWEEHGMSESGLQALVENATALRKLIGRRVSYMVTKKRAVKPPVHA